MIVPAKILVLQTWGIGDMIMTTPMLSSLRMVFPNSHITVIAGSAAAAAVLEPRLHDEVRILPKGWRHPMRALRIFGSLRSSRYDVAFTATRLSPWFAAFLRWCSGIPIVAGDCWPDRWSAHTHRVAIIPEEHRVLANNRILKLLVPHVEPGELSVSIGARFADEAAEIWRARGLEGACVLAVHTGSDPREGLDKRPNADVMRKVIRGFIEGGSDRKAVVFFGPAEASLVKEYAAMGPRVISVRDIPLNTVFSLLARCAAVIGGDAALGHAGAALGIPTVTLAGPTLVSSTRPWSSRNEIVRTTEALDCMPCYGSAHYGRCPHDARCMRGIEPGSITARIDLLLKRAERS